MGLLDVFRPRWKHSDPAVRLEALKSLDDDEALAQAASQDRDDRVRRLAIRQMIDPWRLKNVAHVQTDERLKAVAIGRARELFVEIALSSRESEKDALAAVRDLDSQEHLVEVALKASRPAVRTQALDLVVNKGALLGLIKKASDPEVRRAALARLNDEAALKQVALGERDLAFAKLVLERIKDGRALAEVAQKARNKAVAKLARQLAGLGDEAPRKRQGAAEPGPVPGDDLEDRRRHARQFQLAREAEALADRAARGAPEDGEAAQAMETEWSRVGSDADISVRVRFERALQRFAKLHGAAVEARIAAEQKQAVGRAAAKVRELADRMAAVDPEPASAAAESAESQTAQGAPEAASHVEAAESGEMRQRPALTGEALEAEVAALRALQQELEQAVGSESLRTLDGGVRQAKQGERRALRLPEPQREELASVFGGLKATLIKKLSEAEQREAWKRWANVQRFEALCQQAEVLRDVIVDFPDKDQAPRELANLRSAWRKLGPVPASKRNELWIRFKTACDAVMDVVQAHRTPEPQQVDAAEEPKQAESSPELGDEATTPFVEGFAPPASQEEATVVAASPSPLADEQTVIAPLPFGVKAHPGDPQEAVSAETLSAETLDDDVTTARREPAP